MTFIDELHKSFSIFLSIINKDGHADILSMPYAEYSLQCFAIYKSTLYDGILLANTPLAQAFSALGITQQRDQLMFFIDTFYLF